MTNNMKYLINQITSQINMEFGDNLPTLEQIDEKATLFRSIFEKMYPVSDEDFARVKQTLKTNILHKIGEALTLRGRDAEHQSWYFVQEDNDGFYWNRYKTYLRNVKHWGIDVVNRLNQTTDEVMDDLGNPKDPNRPFQRRGLLLGDVQSGKTATYTAICNKASDSGYRVIIVLAGMMENLRVQTQARLDAEFVGKESKYTFDKKAEQEIRNKAVGVGKIPPNKPEKSIACFTSVSTDFNKAILHAFNLDLRSLTGTALFVVKKNKSVLNNLYQWLIENNSDHETGLIDLPLLLIDDEADNASVNTNSEEKDPTAINQAIRNILNCFRQASYLGITATPFANIFIDPENNDATRDLFPKDFLTVLPTPEEYIGADKIFGHGDADAWDEADSQTRTGGLYGNSIIPILNDEQESFYVFKHTKELADELCDLPESMRKAIRYFVLCCAISDLRKDNTEHRSMLINVSRFTKVQNVTADLVENYVSSIKSDLENYAALPFKKAVQIRNIGALCETWDEFDLDSVAQIDKEHALHNYLLKAAKRIEVRSVNQLHGASSLNYYDYKETGMRVIAVGGNSLSRGLTLEGLCVSYFYRNTMMYDTLLQMGRWFGYRPNYKDLFKIWMAEDAVDWYGYITDAINELKDELAKMKRQNQTPEEFGLKVRQAPGSLLITARNKMRFATSVKRPISVSGRMIETPRLKGDPHTVQENEKLCRSFVESISAENAFEQDDYTKAVIWRNIPKKTVVELVRNYITHPWNLNFQPAALSEYIATDDGLEKWDVAIPLDDEVGATVDLNLCDGSVLKIHPKGRPLTHDENIKNMLKVYGRHVRIGSGGCTKIGLSREQIETLRRSAGSSKDSTFLHVERNPLLLLHILKNTASSSERKAGDPDVVFALGLGFPYDGNERTANYMVNIRELQNWVDIVDEDDDDENS